MTIRVYYYYVFINYQNLELANIELFGGDETWKDVRLSWNYTKLD
jgi:hypothetical protein